MFLWTVYTFAFSNFWLQAFLTPLEVTSVVKLCSPKLVLTFKHQVIEWCGLNVTSIVTTTVNQKQLYSQVCQYNLVNRSQDLGPEAINTYINLSQWSALFAFFQFLSQGFDVSLEFQEDRGLIAVQGPSTAGVLQSLTNVDLSRLRFMTTTIGHVAGVDDCRITRCGWDCWATCSHDVLVLFVGGLYLRYK